MTFVPESGEQLVSTGARQRADDQVAAVYDYLLTGIDNGTLPPGSRLPTERELCKHFGFARHSVRKALANLEVEGLIVRYIGRGTFVKEGYAALERFHDRAAEICSPAEVIEACLLIEPQLAYVAALRAVPADFRTLEECIENARKAETTIEFDKWDNRFHTALVAMSRNNFLINLYEGISHVRREDNWNRLKEQTTTEDIRKKNLAHLKAIAEAIRNRAPAEAESAMRNHLLSVQADLSP